jgi:flagellar biosynthesis component FlhA
MDSDDSTVVRMGTFFLVMGGGVFVLFVISDLAEQVDFDYLFISVLLFFIGWYFRRGKAPPPSAGRFSMINKSRDDARKRKEEKEKAKQDAKKK